MCPEVYRKKMVFGFNFITPLLTDVNLSVFLLASSDIWSDIQ